MGHPRLAPDQATIRFTSSRNVLWLFRNQWGFGEEAGELTTIHQ